MFLVNSSVDLNHCFLTLRLTTVFFAHGLHICDGPPFVFHPIVLFFPWHNFVVDQCLGDPWMLMTVDEPIQDPQFPWSRELLKGIVHNYFIFGQI